MAIVFSSLSVFFSLVGVSKLFFLLLVMIVKIIVSIFSPEFKKRLLLSLIEVIRGLSAYETLS